MTHYGDSEAFNNLLTAASRLRFRPHRIAHLLDEKGRHHLTLPSGFPFVISLFHLREGAITQRLTWHERLELLVPLDGPMRQRMGDLVIELQPGDVLVVDHLKPHQAVDTPGLNTRTLIISFLPECIFTPGSPPTDYAFLIPFHRKVEGSPHVLRAKSRQSAVAHDAIRQLLASFFARREPHSEAGCKAWLLVLLNVLIHEFGNSALKRAEVLRRQGHVAKLQPALNHVREHFTKRISLASAASLCGMSKAAFGRTFKTAYGMTLGSYLNHVRMTRAVELLEETHNSIADIAFKLGFSDQSHFDRRFRRSFGRTPSQHRTRLISRSCQFRSKN